MIRIVVTLERIIAAAAFRRLATATVGQGPHFISSTET